MCGKQILVDKDNNILEERQTNLHSRVDIFHVVEKYPDGAQVWNIDFPFDNYIPLVFVDDNYRVHPYKMALKVEEEVKIYA